MQANTTIVPTDEQAGSISGVARSLQGQAEKPFVLVCPDGSKVTLPDPLVQVLLTAAQAMTRKNGITLVVRSSWLTTQEAADLMGYSRQVIVDLVKKNKLKASKLGTHRRIKLSDLLDYMEMEDKQRDEAMTKLVEHTQEFGGYDQDEDYSKSKKAR